MNRDALLDEYGLLNTEGYLFGQIRLFDLGEEVVNQIIKKHNSDLDYLGNIVSESNKYLYDMIFNRFMTYEEFMQNEVKNEENNEIYSNDIDGYMQYMRDKNPSLASFFLDYFEPYFADNIRKCHTFITGESGSGKSVLLEVIIIQHIMKMNCSAFVLDPHGDLAKNIYTSKVFEDQEQAKRLVIIEPSYQLDSTPIINIFDQFTIRNELDLDRISQEYTNTFANIFQDLGEAPSSRMKTILGQCITVILRKKDGSIWDLLRFVTASNSDLIALGIQDKNPATSQFFQYEFEEDSYKGTKTGIYDRLQSLLKNQIFSGLVTGQSTINIPNCINSNKAVIANLSRGVIGKEVSQAFGRILISIIQIAGLERDIIPEKNRPTTHVFIDEFSNYTSPTITEILAELRKYKVFLTLVNQYVGQDLDANSNKGILGNTKMKIIGQSSYTNSVLISKELHIKPEQITDLHLGEFYLQYKHPKTGKRITILIKCKSDYLNGKFTMSSTAYNSIRIEQIEHFYVKRGKYTPPAFEAFKSDIMDDTKRDIRQPKQRNAEEAPDLELDF